MILDIMGTEIQTTKGVLGRLFRQEHSQEKSVPDTPIHDDQFEKVEVSLLHETMILRAGGFGNGGD